MKDSKPLVSIIVPIHNTSLFLSSSIKSLLSQSYGHIEIIVIDDNSKDGSYKIMKELREQDKRIRYYKNKKKYGLAVCFNRAFRRAKGSFIAFMDAHDISSTKRIQQQINFLLSHPKVIAVGSQCTFIDKKNKRIGKSDFPADHETIYQKLLHGSSFLFEAAMVNKKLLPKDVLHLSANHPFIYPDLFIKFQKYGSFANLETRLHFRRASNQVYNQTLKLLPRYIKLWLTSVTVYDYRPSFRSLLDTIRINPNAIS